MTNHPSTEILSNFRKYYKYDPLSGKIYKLCQLSGMQTSVGSTDKTAGYVQVSIKGKNYRVHRLAWLYMTGSYPEFEIDHINGMRSDNRWENLRKGADNINNQNRRCCNKNSKTGILGVYAIKHTGKFSAAITKDRKQIHLGYFDTAELAHAKYLEARRLLFPGNTL